MKRKNEGKGERRRKGEINGRKQIQMERKNREVEEEVKNYKRV